MSHKAVTVDLDSGNLIWLQAKAIASGHRSVSEVLNEIISRVRIGGRPYSGSPRSIRGTIEISPDDPNLEGADDAVRGLFTSSREQAAR